MDTHGSYVPLPPPPLQPERETEPDWRLSWWTVLYMALGGLVGGIGFRAAWVLVHGAGWSAWFPGGMDSSLGRSVWAWALVGVGVVLADRYGPASWPRSLRWGLGAGVGALVDGLGTWSIRLPLGMGALLVSRLLSRGLTALGSVFVGFYLARVLRSDTKPWRRMPLAGMEAHVFVTGASWVTWIVLQTLLLGGIKFAGAWRMQSVGFAVAQAALIGLVVGCAFAAGLRRGGLDAPAACG